MALQLGVKPGLKRATALALAPQLRFGQADARRDAQALRAVAHAALAFTPMVTLDAAAALPCVLLEVRASLRYFGGLPSLQQRLRAALAPLGYSFRMASAPTALGAALLARWRSGFELGAHVDDLSALRERLDDAPVWLLGPGREHWDALQGMGLRTPGRPAPAAAHAGWRGASARRCSTSWTAPAATAPTRASLSCPSRASRPGSSSSSVPTAASRCCRARSVLLAQLVAWAQAQHARIGGFTLAMRHERAAPRRHRHARHTELPLALAEASQRCAAPAAAAARTAGAAAAARAHARRCACAADNCSAAPRPTASSSPRPPARSKG